MLMKPYHSISSLYRASNTYFLPYTVDIGMYVILKAISNFIYEPWNEIHHYFHNRSVVWYLMAIIDPLKNIYDYAQDLIW